jgi:hypothetical protein
MPRNCSKTRCQMPDCRSWAMRGHHLCRSHLDDQMGLRGGGAPASNLNALKTADHAHPLPAPDLAALARAIARQPDHLPDLLASAVSSIHARTAADPYKTLLALRKTLDRLLPLVAAQLVSAEVQSLLRDLPASQREPLLAAARRCPPARRRHVFACFPGLPAAVVD